jgi:hypothetical protein
MKTIVKLVVATTVLFGAASSAFAQNENAWNGNRYKTQEQVDAMHSGNGSLSGN